jgi:hypothetical protein
MVIIDTNQNVNSRVLLEVVDCELLQSLNQFDRFGFKFKLLDVLYFKVERQNRETSILCFSCLLLYDKNSRQLIVPHFNSTTLNLHTHIIY